MSEKGGSSGQVRMDLLKAAAKELVTLSRRPHKWPRTFAAEPKKFR